MPSSNRAKGKQAEEQAVAYLQSQNYQILNINYHTRYAELDIVAQSPENILVFVEVKSSRQKNLNPMEQVTHHKIKRIVQAARQWCFKEANGLCDQREIRFDIVSVTPNEATTLQHLQNAFSADSVLY
jgi:putative endonuclease